MEGKIERFVVFDVETPNRRNDRISSIGITVVENGKIAGEYSSLVNPETWFDSFNTRLTGIDADSVRDAPAFPELWQEIEPLMSSGILVAHNAVFDLGVLRKCLNAYRIYWKWDAEYMCTVQMGRKLLPGMSCKLNILCEHYGIALDHHRADSDSRACAEILLRYLRAGADPEQHIRIWSMAV